ncbi:hypothetical protein BG011_007702 [Mortierella polycephala]|uniref:Uncharacterized protein n=1 Tax=Mortierella polycephala TaxID=41804 RepID=A0A9P6QDQ2_9FUNG|nr:hypothetical protein BG011_007702 [Mortierella polycephala]
MEAGTAHPQFSSALQLEKGGIVVFYREPQPLLPSKCFWCTICCSVFLFLLVIMIPIGYFILMSRIVQSVVDGSQMSLVQFNIMEPVDTMTRVTLLGNVDHAGIFPATIVFPDPIMVTFKGRALGRMRLNDVGIFSGKAIINDVAEFLIVDTDAFSRFAQEMLTTGSFVWTLSSTIHVKVLGFIPVNGIRLKKNLTLLGMNGFKNIKIEKLDLHADAPNNQGAMVKLVMFMNNPSPIGVSLGSVVLDLFYEDTHLGQVTAKDAVLVGASKSPLILEGTLYRQTEQKHLDNLSVFFSNYLSGKVVMAVAKGVSVKPDSIRPMPWVSDGIMALTLNVPLRSSMSLQLIHGIAIDNFAITLNSTTPYVPTIQSTKMSAGFKLPFNISISARNVSNSIALAYADKVLGNINSGIPSLANLNTSGLISFSLPTSSMMINDGAHEDFDTFVEGLITKAEQKFSVIGLSNATVETSMGVVALTGIPFDSPMTIKCFNFNAMSYRVSNIVISGGTSDHIIFDNMIALSNPSSLCVNGGRVSLNVYDALNVYFGDLVISDLNIVPGSNPTAIQFLFHPANTMLGDRFMSQYLAGATLPLRVLGTASSTSLPELQKALSLVTLSSSVTGMLPPSKLITSGEAISTLNTVLDSHQTTFKVVIQNHLATELYFTGISCKVTWKGSHFSIIDNHSQFPIPAIESASSPSLTLHHPRDIEFSLFLTNQFIPTYPAIVLDGGVMVPFDLDFQIGVRIGRANGYAATIHYVQKQDIRVKMIILGLDVSGAVGKPVPGGRARVL